jgi:hypothetical protein
LHPLDDARRGVLALAWLAVSGRLNPSIDTGKYGDIMIARLSVDAKQSRVHA